MGVHEVSVGHSNRVLQVWECGGGSTRREEVKTGKDFIGACLPQSLLCEHSCFCPQNGILRGVYPGSPTSWLFVVMTTLGSSYCNVDISMGLVCFIQRWLPEG